MWLVLVTSFRFGARLRGHDGAAGDSDTEVTEVINLAVKQGSDLNDGAEKPPGLKKPPALGSGVNRRVA